MKKIYQDIDDYLSDKPFGEFTIKRHKGKDYHLDIYSAETVRYESNEKAFGQLLQMMKDCTDSKLRGKLSFDILFKDGEVKEIVHRGYKRIAYEEDVV